jgi:hypothetical protein
MRSVGIGIVTLLVASCASTIAPGDPVFSGYTRTFKYPVERPHGELMYTGRQPSLASPVIPVMAFGAAFDVDLVLMAKEGDYDMLEFARVSLPNGPKWVALETFTTGEQVMLANLDGIETFVPEIAINRMMQPDLQVTDKSTESTLDVTVDYTNSKGQKVHAYLTGSPPTQPAKHRNGQTFNHSVNQLLVALDIASTESLFKADVEMNGEPFALRNVGGVVPGRFAMEQAMGGMAIASFKVVPGDAGVGGAEFGKVTYNPPGTAPSARATPDMLARLGVQANQASVAQCWKDRFAAKNDLKGGKMAFDLSVQGGRVSAVTPTAVTADAFKDDVLSKCALAAMSTWSLDPSINGTVSLPLSFVAGDVEMEEDARLQLGAITFAEAPPVVMGITAVQEKAGEAAPAPAPEPTLSFANFTSVHTATGGATIEMPWLVSRQGDRVMVRQVTDFRTLEYSYRVVKGQYLELVSITVEQYGRATPVTAVTFNPPLPDVRWPFNGRKASTFVIDINGQQNHAYGVAEAYWTESGPKIKVTPTAPEWVAARPMLTSIAYGVDGTAEVKIERVGE